MKTTKKLQQIEKAQISLLDNSTFSNAKKLACCTAQYNKATAHTLDSVISESIKAFNSVFSSLDKSVRGFAKKTFADTIRNNNKPLQYYIDGNGNILYIRVLMSIKTSKDSDLQTLFTRELTQRAADTLSFCASYNECVE